MTTHACSSTGVSRAWAACALLMLVGGCVSSVQCPVQQKGRFLTPSCHWVGAYPRSDPGTARWHFLDLGVGESAIMDSGRALMLVDGALDEDGLTDYMTRTQLLARGIATLVLTHPDRDHYGGLSRLATALRQSSVPLHTLWDPGYDGRPSVDGAAACALAPSYFDALTQLRALVPSDGWMRPVARHRPLGELLPWVPDPRVTIQLLSADDAPRTANRARSLVSNRCAYLRNNASIVMKVFVDGYSVLMTGDINGKLKSMDASAAPLDVEARLLRLHREGVIDLKSDVLKVPHHGSETSSSHAFIDAVNPRYVIITGDGSDPLNLPALPRPAVVERYRSHPGVEAVLLTSRHAAPGRDHIACGVRGGQLFCDYMPVTSRPRR